MNYQTRHLDYYDLTERERRKARRRVREYQQAHPRITAAIAARTAYMAAFLEREEEGDLVYKNA